MHSALVAHKNVEFITQTEGVLSLLRIRRLSVHTDGISALNGILTDVPSLAILDVSMDGMSGLEILSIIRFQNLPIKVILITEKNELSIYFRAKENQCDGFILNSQVNSELATCILHVLKGEMYISSAIKEYFISETLVEKSNCLEKLTQTEKKVLELVKVGKNNAVIAADMDISEKTVETHKRNICEKLKVPKGKNMLYEWLKENPAIS
ncbi:MAG: response regulator transcription factor [Bacteroidia bacterium]|nr:response regulator transcription factor [Bacteroidia bacterium]